MGKKFILLIIPILILSSSVIPSAYSEPVQQPSLKITIDASRTEGDLPYLFRSGMFNMEWYGKGSSRARYDYLYDKYLADQLPGLNTVYVPLWSESFEDFKDKVENQGLLERTIDKAKKIREAGGEALFSLQDMPRWLSSAPPAADNYWQYPPTDYEQWQNLVAFTVSYIYQQGITGDSYRIWEEADLNFWAGTEEEFCKLYEYSVKGILSADPHAKITFGNLSLSLRNTPSEKPNLLWKMIHYAAEKKLPLDYIIFHPFKYLPVADTYKNSISVVREELKKAGLNEHTPFHAESWNSWLEDHDKLENGLNDERSRERDWEYNAAYIIKTLDAQQGGGVAYQAFFSDVDWGFGNYEPYVSDKNQQFHGDYGIFTKDAVLKPSYNAFQALSILAGKKEKKTPKSIAPTMPEDDFVTVLASQTQDQKATRILLSNFIPAQGQMPHFLFISIKSFLRDAGFSDTDIKLIADTLKKTAQTHPPAADPDQDGVDHANLSYIRWIVSNTDFPSPLEDARIKEAILAGTPVIKTKMEEIAYFRQHPRKVDLMLSHLSPGRYTLTTFLIDQEHSNACRANKETELIPTEAPCGVKGIIDQAVEATRLASAIKAEERVIQFLKKKGLKEHKIKKLIASIKNILKTCQMDRACVREQLAEPCQRHPETCEHLKEAYALYREIQQALFYFGRYQQAGEASSSAPLTIPISIDRINRDKNLFKPLPKGPAIFSKTTDITVPLKGSKRKARMFTHDGAYGASISLQPYAVMLIEISHETFSPKQSNPPDSP